MTNDELSHCLRDPLWRLCSGKLYQVKDARLEEGRGKVVPFVPVAAQREIIEAVYVRKLLKILIPKARQLGMSTVIALIILDMMLFGSGIQAAVVDMTQTDATKKLRGKIRFAFDRLPKSLRARYEALKANDHTLSIRLRGVPGDAPCEVQAGMNARGDTFQVLHISEWGKIAFMDPPRSEEIMTGARPAAKAGLEVIETTWKGGKCGHLWELTKEALEISPEHRTREDFTVFFFPWWTDERCVTEGDARQIGGDCRKYLEETEVEIRKGTQPNTQWGRARPGFKFRPEQRLWYYKVAWKLGLFRFQEYPSMLSECFRAPIEGAIYAEYLDKLRASGAISDFDSDPEILVSTFWDLGAPKNMVTWYVQVRRTAAGASYDVIDCDTGLDLTPGERVEMMRTKKHPSGAPYRYAGHYLPHDAEATDDHGRTIQAELEAVGLENTRVVPRTKDVWVGINRLRLLMSSGSGPDGRNGDGDQKTRSAFRFRTPACEKGVNALEAYRSGIWIEKGRGMDIPVHDKASHPADALRVLAEAEMADLLGDGPVGDSPFQASWLAAQRAKR